MHRREPERQQRAQQGCHGQHLPQARQRAMLEERARAPPAVIEVLARQRLEVGARVVGDDGVALQIDALAGLNHALVEFRVLVEGEGLVVATELQEGAAVEGGVVAMLDETGLAGQAMGRAAVAEPAVLGGGNRCLQAGRAHRQHRHHHGVGRSGGEPLDAPLDEAVGIGHVAIGAHEIVRARIGEPSAEVQGRGLDLLLVVEEPDAGVSGGDVLDNGAGAVRAAAVDHQHLVVELSRPRGDAGDGIGHIALLVERGHDDADEWLGDPGHCELRHGCPCRLRKHCPVALGVASLAPCHA